MRQCDDHGFEEQYEQKPGKLSFRIMTVPQTKTRVSSRSFLPTAADEATVSTPHCIDQRCCDSDTSLWTAEPVERVTVLREPPFWNRLSPNEWRRRIWHVAPGILPWISCSIPHADPLSPVFKMAAVAIALVLATWIALQYHTIQRCTDENRLAAIAGYAFPPIGTLLLFPAHAELALVVLTVIAYGDCAATLCGMLMDGRKLPWNPSKSWAGTIAFVGIAAPLATFAYWGESQPQASWSTAILCATAATVVAAVAESLPVRSNDNIRVGLAASAAVVAMHAMLVGLT